MTHTNCHEINSIENNIIIDINQIRLELKPHNDRHHSSQRVEQTNRVKQSKVNSKSILKSHFIQTFKLLPGFSKYFTQ